MAERSPKELHRATCSRAAAAVCRQRSRERHRAHRQCRRSTQASPRISGSGLVPLRTQLRESVDRRDAHRARPTPARGRDVPVAGSRSNRSPWPLARNGCSKRAEALAGLKDRVAAYAVLRIHVHAKKRVARDASCGVSGHRGAAAVLEAAPRSHRSSPKPGRVCQGCDDCHVLAPMRLPAHQRPSCWRRAPESSQNATFARRHGRARVVEAILARWGCRPASARGSVFAGARVDG